MKVYKICEICDVKAPLSAMYEYKVGRYVMLERVCLKCLFIYSPTLNQTSNHSSPLVNKKW